MGYFFKWRFPSSHILRHFQDIFIFGETISSHFFRVITSTQQLLFLEELFLQSSCFFWGAPFSEQSLIPCLFHSSYFFRAKLLPSSHFLRIRRSLRHFLFGTATFLAEELFRIKIYTEELLLRSRYFFCTHIGKRELFKTIFRITYFWRATFLERLLFQKTLPSIAATFSVDLLFNNTLFKNRYYFTATLPFHSHSFPLSVGN